MERYGLLGETLKHSFSKQIHELISDINYELIELTLDEVHTFMSQKDFKAINVTIPYKETVIPYLDSIDERATRIKAVNTIVNKDGKLYGYNTDYQGFMYLVEHHNIMVENQVVAILGSGGTSKTASVVVEDLKAKKIYHVSRNASDKNISYDELYLKANEIDVIINTTPVGMYPNVDDSVIDIKKFEKCHSVIDVIYNPLNTRLLQEAKACGKNVVNGLEMLIVQGIIAHQYFMNKEYDDALFDNIISKLTNDKQNIVLIGMPTCGKSTIAKELANILNKPLIDIDSLIEERTQMSIPDIFEKYGEPHFREIEASITKEVSILNGQIIACGGGIIKNEKNIDNLRLNGVIIFIDRDIELLFSDDSRPLSNDIDKLRNLYQERYPLYTKYADYHISNNQTIDEAIKKIKEALYEDISH